MRFSPIPLATVVAIMLILSAPTYSQEKDDIPVPAAVLAVENTEPTRANVQVAEASGQVPTEGTPRAAGRKPCRKPSGELVADRPGSDEEFSNFDKR